MADASAAPLDLEEACFQIIASVGSAKSQYVEAVARAREGEFAKAREMVAAGEKDFLVGHDVHMSMLTADAAGTGTGLSLLLVHAEDQLMAAESQRLTSLELIALYERVAALEERMS